VAVAARRIPVALPWRQARRVGQRLTWGIADQGVSSLTNFLLNVYVARTLGAAEFGAFSLAYVTYGFAINASRGLSIEPLLIRFSGTDLRTWQRAAAGCTGTALLVGVATGAGALAVAAVAGGTVGLAFFALGLMLPGLLLQDSWRYAFFAVGRGYHAFLNDVIWAAVQIPLLVIMKMTGHATVFWFVLAWGAGAVVGAAFASLQARVLPSVAGARHWLMRHRDLGPRYLLENTGGNAAGTVQSYCTSSILGLAAVGDIQAANVPMGPFRIVYYGLGMITIPEATRVLRRTPRRLPFFCAAASIALTLLALAWGVVLLVALPMGLGHLMLGALWRPAYPLVFPTTLAIMAMCATGGAAIGLHALGAARRSMRATLITSGVVVAGAVVGAVTAGTLGTLLFVAGGTWFGAVLSWLEFRQAMHDSGTVPVPQWLWPQSSGRHHRAVAANSGNRRHIRKGTTLQR
jgi:O-antigen/teichoic acid export membrane protein